MKLTILAVCMALGCYAQSQSFSSSHLPIVVVSTGNATFNDATIPDEPKMNATMGIIDNGPGVPNQLTDPFTYTSNIGIETRGNSTQGFDKKTYSLELRTAQNQDTATPILGMAKEEDWILHAMMIDKSLLRIPFTFDVARRAGHYASDWRYVELVIDGDYRGVYLFCERIKRDKNRVDIAKLTSNEITGDDLTGGYILRIDWLDDNPQGFPSNYNAMAGTPMFYQYYYPKASNIQPAQATYIQSYMESFESALFAPSFTNPQGMHYSNYVDMTSFADFLIINEISKNSDGYKLSSYVHKDKDSKGGKLVAGPIWDFDQSYGVSNVCSCNDYTGWTYLQNQPGCEDHQTMPMWWQTMMSDDLFKNHLACRWNTLRSGPLHMDSINAWIDQHQALMGTAIDRNFVKWPVIGQAIWEEPTPIPATYNEEIQAMKTWITNRIAWLDVNMPGNCANDVVNTSEIVIPDYDVFPNPADDAIYIRGACDQAFEILTVDGRTAQTIQVTQDLEKIDVSSLSPGTYLLSIEGSGKESRKKLTIR